MELFVKLATGHQRCSVKKGILKIFANLTGRYVLESLLIKLQALKPATLCKKRFKHRCFLMNVAKFFRTAFFFNRTPLVAASEFNFLILNSYF